MHLSQKQKALDIFLSFTRILRTDPRDFLLKGPENRCSGFYTRHSSLDNVVDNEGCEYGRDGQCPS